ncbi:hypothetical protein ACFWDG_10380 [Peribacillus sp. NPDC060186]
MEWIYKYISVTAVIAGVGFLVKFLIQRKINSYFDTRLAQYKQELDVMTERSKYDISKKLFDFEAYAIKKHTIYPELYQQVYQVRIQLVEFTFIVESFHSLNKEPDKTYNLKELIEDATMQNLYRLQQMKQYNLEELDLKGKTIYHREWMKFSTKLNNALSFLKTNELFLSKEVSASCLGTLKEIANLNIYFMGKAYQPSFVSKEIEKVENKVDSLKEAIYEELSYSHFEKNEEKA